MIRWFKKQTIYIRFLLIACVTITIWNIFAFFGGWAVWHLGKLMGIVNYNDLLPDSKFGRIIILAVRLCAVWITFLVIRKPLVMLDKTRKRRKKNGII